MITTDLEVGKFYTFNYVTKDGVQKKKRLAVVLENNTGLLLTWDFSSGGYRNFEECYICDAEDVSNLCVATSNTHRQFPPSVTTKIHNGVLYAVKLN